MKDVVLDSYELASCPFCGGSKIEIFTFNRHRAYSQALTCSDCGATGPNMVSDYKYKQIVEQWNKRSNLETNH